MMPKWRGSHGCFGVSALPAVHLATLRCRSLNHASPPVLLLPATADSRRDSRLQGLPSFVPAAAPLVSSRSPQTETRLPSTTRNQKHYLLAAALLRNFAKNVPAEGASRRCVPQKGGRLMTGRDGGEQ